MSNCMLGFLDFFQAAALRRSSRTLLCEGANLYCGHNMERAVQSSIDPPAKRQKNS